ncbi:PREDICTED: DNA polymerase eta [Bactrocera latifrons]|uniref:DNA polymerase eta n=1 Tax=Bactrocera latifrons TaxID=174628 RepID=A0A0K8VXY3_BACLA|nr:PREDICTED: DNA polymerase eta [Bactrocera latifrons]
MSTRSCVPMQQKYNRVVVLVDMDCFFCQVEEKLNPQLKGQPIAVVQYNAWRGGGIIAVNYAAREKGVTRHMRGDEAKERCPEIQLVKVPNIREKADLGKYREAGKEVATVLQRFTPLLGRASVDEAYLDITEEVNKRLEDMNAGSFMLQPAALINTYAVGYTGIGDYLNVITKHFNEPNEEYLDTEYGSYAQAHDYADMAAVRQSDIRLIIGAAVASEVRAAVKAETGYECSAGIAHNKILAKLACGINKPNKQTILPLGEIPKLFETLPLTKIHGLGGKFGENICTCLNIRFLAELLPFSEQELQRKFDERNGTWLYNICRGIDLEAVTPRFYSKSIGCCKKFPGRNNITGLNTLRHWLGELSNEICDRMEKDMLENNRRAKQMVLSFVQEFDGEEVSGSRSVPLKGYDQEMLTKSSLEVLQRHTKQFFKSGSSLALNNPIKFLGISVGKFETLQSGQNKLQEMFANMAAKKKNETDNDLPTVGREGNGTTCTDTPVAKKPTFFQNFLQRDSNTNYLTDLKANSITSAINVDKSLTVTNAELSAISLTKKFDNSEPPEVRSFFLNALKEQRPKESTYSSTTFNVEAENNIFTNNNEEHKTDISKSFFTKFLKKSDIEENNVQKCTKKNANQLPNTAPCQSTNVIETHMTKTPTTKINAIDLTVELEQHIDQTTFETKTTATTATINGINTTTNKRKYTALVGNTSPTHNSPKNMWPVRAKRTPSPSYEASYVEFAVPELRPEFLLMTKCATCKADIPSDARSIQLHQDHHVAMQLSQQIRDEYRKEVKTKLSAQKATAIASIPGKKSKKSPVQATKAGSNKAGTSITKFLKPIKTSTTTIASNATPLVESRSPSIVINVLDTTVQETVVCVECNLPIVTTALQEHKDFHIAKALQRQLNML